jgi:hypothetical protein
MSIFRLTERERLSQGPFLDEAEFKKVEQLKVSPLSWVAPISPWFLDHSHFNYVVPVTNYERTFRSRVLTGGVQEVKSGFLSKEAKRNIIVAKQIIAFVKNAVPFSDNHMSRARICRLEKNEKKLRQIQHEILATMDEVVKIARDEDATLVQIDAAVRTYKTGNCQELMVVGYLYAKHVLGYDKVEMFEIPHAVRGDHNFLVLGRDQTLQPHEYWTFGPDVMVCGSWEEGYFPARQIDTYLLNYVGSEVLDGRYLTKVVDFDPSYQGIGLHPFMQKT